VHIFLDTVNIDQIRQGAKVRAHIATVPYNVLIQMIRHPFTNIGVSCFFGDWQRISQR